MPGQKVCKTCNELLPVFEFHVAKRNIGGRKHCCKSCVKAASKEYRSKNRDVINRKKRDYYNSNILEVREYHRKYYSDNRELMREYHNQYYQDNIEKSREYSRRHYKNNKEKITKAQRKYYHSDTDKQRDRKRDYFNLNKDYLYKKLKEYRKKFPNKHKAHNAVSNAIRDGKLIREVCEICGAKRSVAHHDDYSKPLEVRWLCELHHKEWHKLNGPGLNG